MIDFSITPPTGWHDLCEQQSSILLAPCWQSLLNKSFKTQTIYALSHDRSFGFTLNIFRVGPFHIGYIGFPTGTTFGVRHQINKIANYLQNAQLPISIDIIRWPISKFMYSSDINFPASTIHIPETAIDNLETWSQAKLPSVIHRNIRKAQRGTVTVSPASLDDSDVIYSMYRNTVRRHHGNLRYNQSYFRQIIKLSLERDDILCWIAKQNGNPAAFIICLDDMGFRYYLHGGFDPHYSQWRLSDFLFLRAITDAQTREMKQFNMLSSPQHQLSLIRYKEKWGGITQNAHIIEIKRNYITATLFKALSIAHNKLNFITLTRFYN